MTAIPSSASSRTSGNIIFPADWPGTSRPPRAARPRSGPPTVESAASPHPSSASSARSGPGLMPASRSPLAQPVGQTRLPDPEIPGHLGHRDPRLTLPGHPDHTNTKLLRKQLGYGAHPLLQHPRHHRVDVTYPCSSPRQSPSDRDQVLCARQNIPSCLGSRAYIRDTIRT